MEYAFRFAQSFFLYILLPIVCIAIWYKWRYAQSALYRYSLANSVKRHHMNTNHPHRTIFFLMRAVSLIVLAILCARPQWIDLNSQLQTDGIDIVLVLDASGSMNNADYADDDRSRFDVAKEEAIRFIQKRTDDAIGLVIFGNETLAKCPLTMDKNMLETMVRELKLGDVDPNGTLLAKSMLTAINRLKRSQAKSKVMILLTDGEPSEEDSDPLTAAKLAASFGIKVYAIGIGSDEDQILLHPFYGVIKKPKVNRELLEKIARDTGGQCFLARDAADMRAVYDTIDQLERTQHEAPIFSRCYELFAPWTLGVFATMFLLIVLSTTIWFAV